jgi:FlaA1/EpsC-like NDP-sugar epimerase
MMGGIVIITDGSYYVKKKGMLMNCLNLITKRMIEFKYVNRWVVFFFDLLFSSISTFVALLFVVYTLDLQQPVFSVMTLVFVSVFCGMISFLSLQTYRNVIRHSTFVESGKIALAALLKVALLFVFVRSFISGWSVRALLLAGLVDLFVTFFILVTLRVLLIVAYNLIKRSANQGEKDNMLILGTGDAAIDLLNASLCNVKGNYRLLGCLTIGCKAPYRINGYRIFSVGNRFEFDHLVHTQHIKAILFPDHTSLRNESGRLVSYCKKRKIRMLLAPSINEINGEKAGYRNLPEVKIETLLNRDEIEINLEEIAAAIRGKVVLVTGAAGSIGSELCNQLCRFDIKRLIMFDSAETPMHNLRLALEEKYPGTTLFPVMGDVRMSEQVKSVFQRFRPQIVFHAAAYKHVPLMEENPCEAVQTNVYGTQVVADWAVKYKVEKFVMISTDKAVNPTNVMGASKRLAEIYVQSLGTAISQGRYPGQTRFVTTRFGNVLGSNGSVIPRFHEQILSGGPVTVTHPEIIRYFMTITEACRLVMEAAFMGRGNEIFVFDMGTPVKIVDLAKRMIELAGLTVDEDIKIEYTGLRPGEKLFEELLNSKENTLPTSNKKIFRASVREYPYANVAKVMAKLCKVAFSAEKEETVRLMKMLIPEFISRQSEYESLDERLNGSRHETEKYILDLGYEIDHYDLLKV